jgi:hypothetical protein
VIFVGVLLVIYDRGRWLIFSIWVVGRAIGPVIFE